ncbi:hypothetical protein V6N11_030204 [Hibiscus sabdariffa]|uniref:Uncharacterized protein n=1 Tax=Hibiscus sabdariffa TaxID=183260 RepID=A0ABR2PK70_9ROSI
MHLTASSPWFYPKKQTLRIIAAACLEVYDQKPEEVIQKIIKGTLFMKMCRAWTLETRSACSKSATGERERWNSIGQG